jgi:hypothetical protein
MSGVCTEHTKHAKPSMTPRRTSDHHTKQVTARACEYSPMRPTFFILFHAREADRLSIGLHRLLGLFEIGSYVYNLDYWMYNR